MWVGVPHKEVDYKMQFCRYIVLYKLCIASVAKRASEIHDTLD